MCLIVTATGLHGLWDMGIPPGGRGGGHTYRRPMGERDRQAGGWREPWRARMYSFKISPFASLDHLHSTHSANCVKLHNKMHCLHALQLIAHFSLTTRYGSRHTQVSGPMPSVWRTTHVADRHSGNGSLGAEAASADMTEMFCGAEYFSFIGSDVLSLVNNTSDQNLFISFIFV